MRNEFSSKYGTNGAVRVEFAALVLSVRKRARLVWPSCNGGEWRCGPWRLSCLPSSMWLPARRLWSVAGKLLLPLPFTAKLVVHVPT